MPKKKSHGIETCPDCPKILQIMATLNGEARFNELVRKAKKEIDPKYSAPRLQRHLIGLRPYIKKTSSGSYVLNLPKTVLEASRNEIKLKVEKLETLSLSQLTNYALRLYGLLSLEEMIFTMKRFLKKDSPANLRLRLSVKKELIKEKWQLIEVVMRSRKDSEYIETLKSLKNERERLIRGI